MANYIAEGDPVADPAFRALSQIIGFHDDEAVRDAAFAAFGTLLKQCDAMEEPTNVVALATATFDMASDRMTAADARRVARRFFAALAQVAADGQRKKHHDPVAVAWAAARDYARNEWGGTAEPDHPLMQETADQTLLEHALGYEPEDLFADPVLRALVHIAARFDAADESGAGDVALGAARMMVGRATPATEGRFGVGLQMALLAQRYNGDLSAASARAIYEAAQHLCRDH